MLRKTYFQKKTKFSSEVRDSYIDVKKIPQHLKLSEEEIKKILIKKVDEIKDYLRKYNFKKTVIGISGGLDSAVSAVITVRALGKKNVYLVRLPYYGISSESGLRDTKKLAKNLKIPKKNLITIPINKPVNSSWEILKKFRDGNLKIRKGNLMARERMKILFDLSAAFGAIVMGTEDKTEAELGYYTLWGDQASGIEPIKNLWKTQVYQIAGFLKEIPEEILLKAPSPGLWKGQTAKKELGIDYLEADIVLSAWQNLKMSKKMITKRFNISSKNIELIFAQAKIGQIKKELPHVLKN